MKDIEVFARCAQAFEIAFLTDEWDALSAYYADECRHIVTEAGPLETADMGGWQIAQGLKRSVDNMDRRFDVRLPEIIEGPELRPDGVWMRFRLRFRRAGLPELSLVGEHIQAMRDGLIVDFRERLDAGMADRANAYLSLHNAALKPVGTAFTPPPDPRDAEALETLQRRNLVRIYAAAKSAQDIEGALSVCHPEFTLQAWGLVATGKDASRAQLHAFFAAFPDFRASVSGLVADASAAACWGELEMTHAGSFLGATATGRPIRAPFASTFSFKDLLIVSEHFFADLADLCAQTGLSADELQARIDATQGARS